jgi:hypothetical protein
MKRKEARRVIVRNSTAIIYGYTDRKKEDRVIVGNSPISIHGYTESTKR